MKIEFHKCHGEFLLLPCLSYYHHAYLDELNFYFTKEVTLGWLFWFVRINFNTTECKIKYISILPEINFVWFEYYSSYIALKWLKFSKCITIKKNKKHGKN
jgi:hypothetical protein